MLFHEDTQVSHAIVIKTATGHNREYFRGFVKTTFENAHFANYVYQTHFIFKPVRKCSETVILDQLLNPHLYHTI